MIGRLWHDPRVVFTVLGAASGVAGAVAYGRISDPTQIAFPEVLWEVSVGVIFGAVMGGALARRGSATAHQAIVFALLATLSWLAAHRFGVMVATRLELDPSVVGVLAGLVGAGGIAGSLAWLFPLYRNRRAWLTIAGTGGAFGILLAGPSAFTLFPPWQAAVGLAIAWPLWRSAQESANRSG